MKLSMSMLAEYLSAYQPECHIRDDTVCIQGIRFLSDRHPERSLDYVYIGSASSFFQDPRFQDAVILANGHNQILCHSADEEDLLNDVLSAFDFYQSLQQSLYEKSLRHAPIGAMLRDAGKVYRGALLLFDIEGSVIASSHEEVLKDPDLKGLSDVRGRGRSLGTGTISHTFVDRDGRISHDLTGKPQLLHIKGAETDQPGCVCLYLVQNDENVGFMLYFPLTEEEARTGLQTAEEWTGYFAQAEEFTAVSSYRQSDHEIFRKLLAGENVPSAVIGKLRKHALQDGNLCLSGRWRAGDTVHVDFPMPVRVLTGHPMVKETAHQVCYSRGPLVYCAEEKDNGAYLHLLQALPEAEAQVAWETIGSLRLPVLKVPARRRQIGTGGLYRPWSVPDTEDTSLTLVPYFAWGNRGAGEMRVWLFD